MVTPTFGNFASNSHNPPETSEFKDTNQHHQIEESKEEVNSTHEESQEQQ
jgi:hypothetical protein